MTESEKSEKKPRAPRKKTDTVKPVQHEVETVEEVKVEAVEEPETVEEDGKPVLVASSLVAHNDYARNSRSVRAVQDALINRGHWEVEADPAGYWGAFTQSAALSETNETEPADAARALGFTVV